MQVQDLAQGLRSAMGDTPDRTQSVDGDGSISAAPAAQRCNQIYNAPDLPVVYVYYAVIYYW
jgi:hypothetical protein